MASNWTWYDYNIYETKRVPLIKAMYIDNFYLDIANLAGAVVGLNYAPAKFGLEIPGFNLIDSQLLPRFQDILQDTELVIDEANSGVFRKPMNIIHFEDFKTQLQQIKKMGNLKDLMGMIPGVGKQIKDLDINDDAFKGIEAMINSMTMEERRNPDIINPSRKNRIAKGSGKELAELNQFLKQFEQMKSMMKMMNKMPMGRMPGLGGMMGR